MIKIDELGLDKGLMVIEIQGKVDIDEVEIKRLNIYFEDCFYASQSQIQQSIADSPVNRRSASQSHICQSISDFQVNRRFASKSHIPLNETISYTF